jgi:hypothetical protein
MAFSMMELFYSLLRVDDNLKYLFLKLDTLRYNFIMGKIFVGILTLTLFSSVFGQTFDISRDVITDPNLSLKCKDLMQDRSEKIKFRQKLNDLLQRTDYLMKRIPFNKSQMRIQTEANQINIKNELYLADLQVKSMEENIIRSGCPGINL